MFGVWRLLCGGCLVDCRRALVVFFVCCCYVLCFVLWLMFGVWCLLFVFGVWCVLFVVCCLWSAVLDVVWVIAVRGALRFVC